MLIVARLEGRKGGKLWDRVDPDGYGNRVDLSHFIKKFRFMEIKRYIPFIFANESKWTSDPWWQFIDGVNEYRKEKLSASLKNI